MKAAKSKPTPPPPPPAPTPVLDDTTADAVKNEKIRRKQKFGRAKTILTKDLTLGAPLSGQFKTLLSQ